jgi:hypothetical protein
MLGFAIKLFIYIFALTTFRLHGIDYKVDIPINVIEQSNFSVPISINEHDEVLLKFYDGPSERTVIWNKKDTLDIIPNLEGVQFYKLGNNGMVLGSKYDDDDCHPCSQSIVWSRTLGIQIIDISKNILDVRHVKLIDINSFGQIIGSYKDLSDFEHAFIWEHGKAREFSISEEAALLGYNVLSINVKAINDQGSILGSFTYGSKHPLKNSWIIEGTKFFLWSGTLNLIDNPKMYTEVIDLNNNNTVLVHGHYPEEEYTNTFLWDPRSGLSLVSENFRGLKFNDKNQIIGYSNKSGAYCLLDKELLTDLSPDINGNLVDINNNGVILFQGGIWGELHALKLSPIYE